jgi:hypothetical protein
VSAETDGEGSGASASDVERYEQLRARALAGEGDGFRMGLAMLQRRGVAAWTRAWQSTLPAARASPARPAVELRADPAQIVDVLAAMALACARAG